MEFTIETRGNCDIIDITGQVNDIINETGFKNGICLVSCSGSTCGVTTIEYESGAVKDLKTALERLIPSDGEYEHNKTWGDGNGFSHIRSALIKPFFAVPVMAGRAALGSWQNIVFLDFDNRPRRRQVTVVVAKA